MIELIGVVHLGLGAFQRAHQALVFDALLAAGDTRWRVLGCAMRSTELVAALRAQDHRYHVRIASAHVVAWAHPQSLADTAVLALERARVVAAIAAPQTRWLTLTVTEKGYDAALAQVIVEGLRRRYENGVSGLTLASCDNLRDNGRVLRALCMAQVRAPDFRDWIDRQCAFPCSMVDRIVPAATHAVRAQALAERGVADACTLATEAFWEWVIEDHFADPADGQALASVGVKVVGQVREYEEAKLRLLNGAHTAMACIGTVAGIVHVSDFVAHPAARRFIERLMTEEIGPTVARADWAGYADALLTRFENPTLAHRLAQIAGDSSQKIPQRWAAAIAERRARGAPVARYAFAAAAWMRHLRGVDDAGRTFTLSDPLATTLAPLAHGAPAQVAAQLGGRADVWGPVLAQDARWHSEIAVALSTISQKGVLAALSDTFL